LVNEVKMKSGQLRTDGMEDVGHVGREKGLADGVEPKINEVGREDPATGEHPRVPGGVAMEELESIDARVLDPSSEDVRLDLVRSNKLVRRKKDEMGHEEYLGRGRSVCGDPVVVKEGREVRQRRGERFRDTKRPEGLVVKGW
jgi:hypothetical protein